jgi:hypothetical protein
MASLSRAVDDGERFFVVRRLADANRIERETGKT